MFWSVALCGPFYGWLRSAGVPSLPAVCDGDIIRRWACSVARVRLEGLRGTISNWSTKVMFRTPFPPLLASELRNGATFLFLSDWVQLPPSSSCAEWEAVGCGSIETRWGGYCWIASCTPHYARLLADLA